MITYPIMLPHEEIVTDQGSEFKETDFAEWLQGMRIEYRQAMPYHLQSNGKTEHLNWTRKGMPNKLLNGSSADGRLSLVPFYMPIRSVRQLI